MVKCRKDLAGTLGISEDRLERRTEMLVACRSRLHSHGIDLAEID